jgi:hypothetical protein
MLELRLELNSENASVETPEMARQEALRCMGVAMARIRQGVQGGYLRDINGNQIGHWLIETEEDYA